MKDRKPIPTKASQPKRGTKFMVDGKELYLYRVKSPDNYLLCDDPAFGLEANYIEFNPNDIKPATKPRSEINKVSDKQEKINRAYAVISSQFKKDHLICQVCIKCKGAPTTDCHHPIGRIGKAMLDSTQYVATCRACHQYLELNPIEAKKLGFSKSRLQTTK
jgi:hypothetical protein